MIIVQEVFWIKVTPLSSKKYVIRVLDEELKGIGLMSTTFLIFALFAGGMENARVFFATAGVLFFGVYLYSEFRRGFSSIVSSHIDKTFKQLEKEIRHLNSLKLLFFAKCGVGLSIVALLGNLGYIMFPLGAFPTLLALLYIVIFKEEVSSLLGFDQLKMAMLNHQGIVFLGINRIEKGKMAFSCGIGGLLIFCYVAKGVVNYSEIFFSGIIIAGIVAYIYNFIVEESYNYESLDKYIYRNLNYSGKTCYYRGGQRYEPVPTPESNDFIDCFGYSRDRRYYRRPEGV